MAEEIHIGDRVKVFLDSKFGRDESWVEGTVFKIDPYSEHRRFYWVELDEDIQAMLNIKQILCVQPEEYPKIVGQTCSLTIKQKSDITS